MIFKLAAFFNLTVADFWSLSQSFLSSAVRFYTHTQSDSPFPVNEVDGHISASLHLVHDMLLSGCMEAQFMCLLLPPSPHECRP